MSRSMGGNSIASSTGYEASMDEEYDGNGEASRSEVVLVFAVHAPPQHLVEVLDCEDTAKRMRGIGVFGGMFGRRAGGKEVPSPSNAALPGGRRPKWCMAAEDLAAEITAEVSCPTIGIGASSACDGQILVTPERFIGVSPMPAHEPEVAPRVEIPPVVLGQPLVGAHHVADQSNPGSTSSQAVPPVAAGAHTRMVILQLLNVVRVDIRDAVIQSNHIRG